MAVKKGYEKLGLELILLAESLKRASDLGCGDWQADLVDSPVESDYPTAVEALRQMQVGAPADLAWTTDSVGVSRVSQLLMRDDDVSGAGSSQKGKS